MDSPVTASLFTLIDCSIRGDSGDGYLSMRSLRDIPKARAIRSNALSPGSERPVSIAEMCSLAS